MNISRQLEVFFIGHPVVKISNPREVFFLSLLTIFYELEGLKISLQIFFQNLRELKNNSFRILKLLNMWPVNFVFLIIMFKNTFSAIYLLFSLISLNKIYM